MNKEEIYAAIKDIERQCEYTEVENGRVETYIDTTKFYNRIKGLMALLKNIENEQLQQSNKE